MGDSPVVVEDQPPRDDAFASPKSPIAEDQDEDLSALLEHEEEDQEGEPADGEGALRGGAHAGGTGGITGEEGTRVSHAPAVEAMDEVNKSFTIPSLASARHAESSNPSESSPLEGETPVQMTEL
jgi:hypothetical protein